MTVEECYQSFGGNYEEVKKRLPSEGFIYGDVLRYECKIEVFGVQKRIRLHYNKSQTKWNIYY